MIGSFKKLDCFIRKYIASDFTSFIKLLLEDDLGQSRESLQEESKIKYKRAIQDIIDSKLIDIYIMTGGQDQEVIGCFQIMYLPHVSFQGTKRCQIESVRIRKDLRGQGLGSKLIKHAIKLAKENNCGLFQLTSNKDRQEKAHQFYKNLGMVASHEGYKLIL